MASVCHGCCGGKKEKATGSKDTDTSEEVMSKIGIFGFELGQENGVAPSEYVAYKVENLVSSQPNAYFWGLLILTVVIIVILGAAWMSCEQNKELGYVMGNSTFVAFQVIASGGFDPDITEDGAIIVYICMIFTGVIIFAILIGMITESFQSFVNGMSEGKTKVATSGHTVILGWNETTIRVILQMALLQVGFHSENSTWARTIFWWTRAKAYSPVFNGTIVVLTNQKTKAEMQEAIEGILAERGVPSKYIRVGRNIVCRIGDPTNTLDLQRVGVQRAKSILVQMTDADTSEEQEHGIQNGITLRVLLALRVVLFGSPTQPPWEDLRVVVQLASPSKAVDVISFGRASDGRPILNNLDLSLFLNNLMFNCCAQPGLAFGLLDLVGFEGAAIRFMKVTELPHGGRQLIGKTFKECALIWEDATLAGVISQDYWTADPKEKGVRKELDGLAPSGDRIIKATDSVIFISEATTPTLASGPAPAPITTRADAKVAIKKKPLNVLVCGWRTVWESPEILGDRIRETARTLPPGSSITFLASAKRVAVEQFAAIMKDVCDNFGDDGTCLEADMFALPPVGGEPKDARWSYKNRVSIRHICGDSTDYEQLKKVVRKGFYDRDQERDASGPDGSFNTAVVMSSVGNDKMSPVSRDTRALTIMLYLRHLQKKYKKEMPMHVIGENAVDSTALLAMVPKGEQHSEVPDFINVNAIYARALVQGLTYPAMISSVTALFSTASGTPNVVMLDCGDFVMGGRYNFGSLVALFQEQFPDDILMGIFHADGQMDMAPKLSATLRCDPQDKFLLISRRERDADAIAALGTPMDETLKPETMEVSVPGQMP